MAVVAIELLHCGTSGPGEVCSGRSMTVLLCDEKSWQRARRKPKKLSHYDEAGRASMVDVSAKSQALREAEA